MISLPVSIDAVRKERILTIEWLRDKPAEAGTTIPPIKGPIARRAGARAAWPSLASRAQPTSARTAVLGAMR
jgi:hypothetical protein